MRYLLKNVLIGVIIAFLLTLVFMAINYGINGEWQTLENTLISFKYNLLYSIVLSVVNSQWYNYLNKRVKWGRFKQYHFLATMLGSAILTLISVFFIRMYHEMVWVGMTYNEFIENEFAQPYIITVIIALTIGLIIYAGYYFREKQKTKVKEQTIIAGTASARFDALKNQLDPHFLFNSLNVLTSLIEENPRMAQDFTTSLSKVYRYVLEQKNKDLVTVDEELDFARSYMALLKMRFEDSIVFDIPDSAQNPESKVVPLSLQLLLENAVKHNVVTSTKPLHIKIYEADGNLIVENNLQPKQIVKKSTGVGLSNIQQRYKLLTQRKVKINQHSKQFSVAIPVLLKRISVMKPIQANFDDSYVRARKHVEELKEFYYSLLSYFIVIPFLIFINYNTYWGFQWFWFPLFGWAIGLFFQAYKLFVNDGVFGRSWEKKKIEKYIREEEERARYR